jgi:glutathione peroxidase
MTTRQQILKWIYPLLIGYKKALGQDKIRQADPTRVPSVPFHQLSVTLNNGSELSFESLRNKKVLLVNTASNCGFTNQYSDLQKLYEAHKQDLVIIGLPSERLQGTGKGKRSGNCPVLPTELRCVISIGQKVNSGKRP